MGAWIEILLNKDLSIIISSVAPLMGAWIEIIIVYICLAKLAYMVAPLMGAWIEISGAVVTGVSITLSRPSWARGLKSVRCHLLSPSILSVAPLMGAWIEICENNLLLTFV